MSFSQIFDMINMGLVVIDKEMNVRYWNRWMEIHSGISSDEILNRSIFEHFRNLDTPRFNRNCKSVFKLGNFCFFSQKLHKYLFPLKTDSSFKADFDYMQQSCTMGPLRNGSGAITDIFIAVQDVTEVVMYEQQLLEMNTKDGLTGAYNRRFLETQLCKEMERAKRYKRPISVLMLDIDHFKKVNDTYGHQCGDLVLKTISSVVQSCIRKTDFFARYGGEEFCCILPETKPESAVILAERIRKGISKKVVKCKKEPIKVTVSLGVAGATEIIDSPDRLLKKADDALYKAKETGRNRVVVFNDKKVMA